MTTENQHLTIEEVRMHIHTLYAREGTWEKVSKLLGISKGTAHDIAVKGTIPHKRSIRDKLGMGPLCPHCGRVPKARKRKPTRIRDMKVKDLRWALENRKEM